MSSSNDGSNGSIVSGSIGSGSINMYKAITPLDYVGPEVTLDVTSDFTTTGPDDTTKIIAWTREESSVIIKHAYNNNRLVLVDQIRINETNTIGGLSPIADPRGILYYKIGLANSAEQIVNKYCIFRFTINYIGTNLSTLEVNLYVTTMWMLSPKLITVNYNGPVSSGTIDIPEFYVDWTDPTVLTQTVLGGTS